MRDEAHGALGLGAHRVVVAVPDLTLEARSLLQPRGPEPKPLGEEPQQGAPHGGGVRIPLDGLVAADGWDARRPPGRASRARTLSGWCRASSRRGPETGRRWRSRRPRRAWRGALGGGELVEGAHGGERPRGVLLGDAEGPVVVDQVEEAPAAGGLGGGEGRGEGEVDDGNGDPGARRRRGPAAAQRRLWGGRRAERSGGRKKKFGPGLRYGARHTGP